MEWDQLRRVGTNDLIKRAMKPDDMFVKLAQTFKAIGDLTRSKIIFALYNEELCVCDLAPYWN